MENSIHHQKLLALRSDARIQEFHAFKSTKLIQRVRTRLFPFVTVLLILIVILFGLVFRTQTVVSEVKQKQAEWIEQIIRLLEVPDVLQDQYWESLKQDIKLTINPLTEYTGVNWKIDEDIDRVISELKNWQRLIKPLLDYEFGITGFVSKTNKSMLFTDTLEVFFSKAQMQYAQSVNLWNSLWYYRLPLIFTIFTPFRDFLTLGQQMLDSVKILLSNSQLILELLGHNSRQRFLLFTQNTGEARPTGGFLGSYISVQIIKGTLEIGGSNSIYLFDNSKTNSLLSHPATSYYGLANGDEGFDHGIRNLNYFQCFPLTAKMIEREWATSNTENAFASDGVVFISPYILENILPPTFSFDVPGIGMLSGANIISQVERLTSIETDNPRNPKSSISVILTALISQIPAIIALTSPLDFLQSVLNSIYARDLQIWFKNQQIQSISSYFGFDASQTCASKNTSNKMSLLISNLSSDKRNLESWNEVNMYTEKLWNGVKFTINYKQKFKGKPFLQRGFNDIVPMTFVGLQVPDDAFNLSVTSPQGLNLPLEREYTKSATLNKNSRLVIPEEVEFVRQSTINLGSGFVYSQMDGSRVIGTYIQDEGDESSVQYSFVTPYGAGQKVVYYGQPGLNNPSLSLGNGLRFSELDYVRVVEDRILIQSGVDISVT